MVLLGPVLFVEPSAMMHCSSIYAFKFVLRELGHPLFFLFSFLDVARYSPFFLFLWTELEYRLTFVRTVVPTAVKSIFFMLLHGILEYELEDLVYNASAW